jgi:hypothetical protein
MEIMKTGIITYRKYEERVTLNAHFITTDLFNIILNDTYYVKFQIVDEKENLLLSTDWKEAGESVSYLKVVKVERDVEILGTTYNAYNTPSLTYKTKVTWIVDGGRCKTKKEAHRYADKINLKASRLIEKFIEGRDTINNKI